MSATDWTEDCEVLLEELRQNCVYLNKFHKLRYFYFKKIIIYFRLPTIIISSFASVASGLGREYLSQPDITSLVVLMSLSVSILNSIELFLKINETTILELETSKSYYQLSLNIHKTLRLKRENRKITGLDALEKFYRDYSELYESSALISKHYPDKLVDIEKKKNKFFNKPTSSTSSSTSSSSSSSSNTLEYFDEDDTPAIQQIQATL
jgi:hypothetical protein